MKSNFLLTKLMLLLCLLVGSVNGAWAAEETDTYVFTAGAWKATLNDVEADWTSNKAGNFTANQGVQITTNTSGANATSPVSFKNVSKIVVTYCTNASKGSGTIEVQVGTGEEQTFNVTKPSSGGTTLKTATFNFSPAENGEVKITGTASANSVYIYSIAITHDETAISKPSIATIADIDDTQLDFNATGTFTRPTITPATGATEGDDYEVEWSSADANMLTLDAKTGEYLVGDTKGTVEVTLTVEPYDDAVYEAASKTFTVTIVDPNANDGTLSKPYTVAEARAAIDAGEGVTGVYAKGIVSEIVTAYNSQYGNISYNISADGDTESDQLQAYRGKSYAGNNFTSDDDIQVGDEVVVYGNLKKYNSIYEFAADNQLVSRSKRVQLAASGYASYCSPLPLDLTPTENYAAWAVTATNNTEVTFTKIQGAVPAATPFILYGEGMDDQTISLPVATGATTAVACNMLKGTLEETSVSTVNGEYTNFGLSNGAFVKLNNGSIPANKAYLPILTANVPTAAARLTIVFDEGMATGIANINRESTDNRYFNLNGQQVKTPQKGMYIVNGKKVIIK